LQLAVVTNLLTNAAVHGRADGNVEVSLGETDTGTAAVAIADDGAGDRRCADGGGAGLAVGGARGDRRRWT